MSSYHSNWAILEGLPTLCDKYKILHAQVRSLTISTIIHGLSRTIARLESLLIKVQYGAHYAGTAEKTGRVFGAPTFEPLTIR
jgi:hypothetical protein